MRQPLRDESLHVHRQLRHHAARCCLTVKRRKNTRARAGHQRRAMLCRVLRATLRGVLRAIYLRGVLRQPRQVPRDLRVKPEHQGL